MFSLAEIFDMPSALRFFYRASGIPGDTPLPEALTEGLKNGSVPKFGFTVNDDRWPEDKIDVTIDVDTWYVTAHSSNVIALNETVRECGLLNDGSIRIESGDNGWIYHLSDVKNAFDCADIAVRIVNHSGFSVKCIKACVDDSEERETIDPADLYDRLDEDLFESDIDIYGFYDGIPVCVFIQSLKNPLVGVAAAEDPAFLSKIEHELLMDPVKDYIIDACVRPEEGRNYIDIRYHLCYGSCIPEAVCRYLLGIASLVPEEKVKFFIRSGDKASFFDATAKTCEKMLSGPDIIEADTVGIHITSPIDVAISYHPNMDCFRYVIEETDEKSDMEFLGRLETALGIKAMKNHFNVQKSQIASYTKLF